jgi:hypothetical protein
MIKIRLMLSLCLRTKAITLSGFHCIMNSDITNSRMWSVTSVAHTTPVREVLGSNLTQTQEGILMDKLSSPSFRQQA